MTTAGKRFSIFLGLLLLALFGCGGAAEDESAVSTAVIGNSGGTISAEGGLSIDFPAGAVTTDVEFKVYRSTAAEVGTFKTVSDVWRVEPGILFKKPVKVSIQLKDGNGKGANPVMYWSGFGEHSESMLRMSTATLEGDKVVAQVLHFSRGCLVAYPLAASCGNRFTDSGEGVVTDSTTGLQWVALPYLTGIDHATAAMVCSGEGFDAVAGSHGYWGGVDDWRLPTEEELLTLEVADLAADCKSTNTLGQCELNAVLGGCPAANSLWTADSDGDNYFKIVTIGASPWGKSRAGGYSGAPGLMCVRGFMPACTPSCDGLECGPDPVCNSSCGTCGENEYCLSGKCTEWSCTPSCENRECGPDPVCGVSCGECSGDLVCDSGKCVKEDCEPDCGSAVCGLDPACGVRYCGRCEAGRSCVDGACVSLTVEDGMVEVPTGVFKMGCNDNQADSCDSGELPYHDVTLTAYAIDQTEVTVEKYGQCVSAGACSTPGTGGLCNWAVEGREDNPINCVDWFQASAYCAWVGKQLPTEAQWEKAARGTDGRMLPWLSEDWVCAEGAESDPDAGAWCAATADQTVCDFAVVENGDVMCGTGTTAAVCSTSPAGDSPFGLCDAVGNVFEWVADWYSYSWYKESPASNPTGPENGSGRIIRGGGIHTGSGDLKVTGRYGQAPGYRADSLGFRCAKTSID